MMTVAKFRRPALVSSVFAALAAALVSTAGPALADNSIDISGIGDGGVLVDYSCDANAGVVAIKAMVGAPDADRPSSTGAQNAVTCDGSHQSTVIEMGPPLTQGQRVQVRVALVDRDDIVVSGQAKVTP